MMVRTSNSFRIAPKPLGKPEDVSFGIIELAYRKSDVDAALAWAELRLNKCFKDQKFKDFSIRILKSAFGGGG